MWWLTLDVYMPLGLLKHLICSQHHQSKKHDRKHPKHQIPSSWYFISPLLTVAIFSLCWECQKQLIQFPHHNLGHFGLEFCLFGKVLWNVLTNISLINKSMAQLQVQNVQQFLKDWRLDFKNRISQVKLNKFPIFVWIKALLIHVLIHAEVRHGMRLLL